MNEILFGITIGVYAMGLCFGKRKLDNEETENLLRADINLASSDIECCICLEFYLLNIPIIILECGHFFHKDCIEEWFKKKRICPMCCKKIDVDIDTMM